MDGLNHGAIKMKKVTSVLYALLLCGCAGMFDPVELPVRRVEGTINLQDGTPIPVAWNFPERYPHFSGRDVPAYAIYHVFADGSLDYSQRCEMTFNAAWFTPDIIDQLGLGEPCDIDAPFLCHEATHCREGDFHGWLSNLRNSRSAFLP